METCRICVSPAGPKRLGSLFTPNFFWILLVLSSFFANLIHLTSAAKNPNVHHEQQQRDNKNLNRAPPAENEQEDEDDVNEFAEFDGEISSSSSNGGSTGGGGSEKSSAKIKDEKQQQQNAQKSDSNEQQHIFIPLNQEKPEEKFSDNKKNRDISLENERDDDEEEEEDDFEFGESVVMQEKSSGKEKMSKDQQQRSKFVRVDSNLVDDDLEGLVEDEIDEEDAEFVGDDQNFDKKSNSKRKPASKKSSGLNVDPQQQQQQPAQLKITDVPAHLRNNWSNFQVELVMLFGLVIYLVNYAIGKTKNHKLATTWFECNREILYNNFEVVGDDGTTQEIQKNILMKESDHVYSLWCTGRPGCQGSFVQLKLLKRQDLVALVLQLFKPQSDKVCVRFNLNPDDLDSCILCMGNRKTVAKLFKETTDLGQYCTEKKSVEKLGLPESFSLYAETAEATNGILDSKTIAVIQKYEQLIDYIHISDQYCGLKANDGEPQAKLPETSRIAVFQFNVPGRLHANEKSIQDLVPLLTFAFYCMDKIRRFRLSREAKQKCDKNRLMAQETYLKQTHAQRQEAAQSRREEKARERKERVLQEEDPEKQRRLEKLEQKREQKKKQPRVKQLKIKAG